MMLAAWGANGAALGVDSAILMAVDQALAIGPAQRCLRPRADGTSVRELGQVAAGCQIIALVLGVVVQYLGELFPGHVAVRVVQALANARHHIVLGGPGDGVHSQWPEVTSVKSVSSVTAGWPSRL